MAYVLFCPCERPNILFLQEGNEGGDFSSEAKFRRYGLLKNPILRSTGEIAGNETMRTKTLVVKNHDALVNIHFERSTDAGHQGTEPINTEGWTNWPVSSGYEDIKNLPPQPLRKQIQREGG